MSSTLLYRDFTLRNPSAWAAIVAFVKANAQAIWDRDRFLRVIITEEDRARTSQQNRFYFGPVLDAVTDSAWVDGRQYRKDVWHEFFARMFLSCEELILPDGEIVQRRQSTTDLSVSEFTEYLEKVRAYAATELGVEFDGL